MPMKNSNSKTLYDTLTVLHGTDALGASRNGYLGSDDLPKDKDTTVQIIHCLHGTGTFAQGRQEEADFLELMWLDGNGQPTGRRSVMVVNSTNRKTLAALFGSVEAYILEGKVIRLYVDPRCKNPAGSGYVPGIRIRKIVCEQPAPVQPVQTNPVPPVVCQDCGQPIIAAGDVPAEQVLSNGRQWFGLDLCADCQTRRINEQNNK